MTLDNSSVESLKAGLEDKFKLEFQEDFKFGGKYHADLKYGKLLLSLNKTADHSIDVDPSDGGPRVKRGYHQAKAMAARRNGYTLIQIYEWDDMNVIEDMIRSKLKMQPVVKFARKMDVQVIEQSDANEFLEENHIQGGAKGQSYCIGLYDENGELLQVQTFGKSRFAKNVEWEAIRLASKHGVCVIGGVSRGFKRFIRDNDPESIVSYDSLDRSSGATDEKTGFKFERTTGGSAIWTKVNPGPGDVVVRDTSLQALGIDRVLRRPASDFPDYDGTFEHGNTGLMLKEGYVRVFNSGNLVYVWRKEDQKH